MSTTPPANLNRLVPWYYILEVLGTKLTVEALPCAGLLCPICRKLQLTIYQDTIDQGQWHYCNHCESAGDMITLAASAWKKSIQETVSSLVNYHIPHLQQYNIGDYEIQRYQHGWVDRQKRARGFLTSKSHIILENQGLGQLRSKLDISADLGQEGWWERGGRFVVAAGRKSIDKMIGNNHTDSIFQGYGDKSRRWKIILAIPFYDLPGRISAYLFCLEENGELQPLKYHSFLPRKPGEHVPEAPGIAMYDGLTVASGLTDSLFVLMDPVMALRIHLQHFTLNSDPLPLVAVQPSAPPALYIREHLVTRKIVFYAPQVTLDLIRHAKAIDAHVCVFKLKEDLCAYFGRVTPSHCFKIFQEKAQPWPVALDSYLKGLPLADAVAFLFQLDWDRDELKMFLEDFASEKNRKRLEGPCQQRFLQRAVTVNGQDIIETETGWQLARSGEVISDVSFKLDRVIQYQDGSFFYQGFVKYKGKDYDFAAPGAEFDKGPLQWLRTFLMRESIGVPNFNRTWQTHALTIAQKFQAPTIVTGIDRCGWDDSNSRIVTANYVIEMGGKIKPHNLPAPGGVLATHLPLPSTPVHIDDITLLETHDHAPYFWSVVGCVLANVLARAYNQKPMGVLISGPGSSKLRELARMAGCPEVTVSLRRKGCYDEISRIEEQNNWPVVIKENLTSSSDTHAWAALSLHNCFACTTRYAALIYGVSGKWLHLEAKSCPYIEHFYLMAGKIVVEFLKDVMERRLLPRQPAMGATIQARVFRDLGDWFHDKERNPQVIRDAANRVLALSQSTGPGWALLDMLAMLFKDGRIFTARIDCIPQNQFFRKHKNRYYPTMLYLSDEHFWIPEAGLNNALAGNARLPSISNHDIWQALIRANYLIGTKNIQGMEGWVIPTKQWEAALARLRYAQAGPLGAKL